MMFRFAPVVCAVVLAALALPRAAAACTCSSGPARFLGTGSMTIPANGRGVVFWSGGGPWVIDAGGSNVAWDPPPQTEEFTLQRVSKGAGKPIPLRVEPIVEPAPWGKRGRAAWALRVVATEELLPGERYRFTGPEDSSLEVTVDKKRLENAAPLPLEIGPEAEGLLKVAAGMSCSMNAGAVWRAVSVKLPADVRSFLPALLVHTRVDGTLWRPSESYCTPTAPGRSWRGEGKELVYSVCEGFAASSSAGEGKHIVEMEVELPGAGVFLRSEKREITIACAAREPEKPAPPSATDSQPRESSCGRCSTPAPASSLPWSTLSLLALMWLRKRNR